VAEYWGTPAQQAAFDRIARRIIALEVEHAISAAIALPDDPNHSRLTASLAAAWSELGALPNAVAADIVLGERLDLALDRRLRELAVEQRLLLARVKPTDREGKQMAATIAAVTARRAALHARQDSLYADFRANPSIAPGEWVRITIPAGDGVRRQRATGRLLEMRQDSVMWMSPGAKPRTVVLSDKAILERVASRRGHAWEGALIGLVAGNVAARIKRGSFDDEGEIRALVLTPFGALIGGLLGSTIYSEEWVPVIWPIGRVTAAPTGTGLGLRWSLPPFRGPR
jgi:hypothetical protein